VLKGLASVPRLNDFEALGAENPCGRPPNGFLVVHEEDAAVCPSHGNGLFCPTISGSYYRLNLRPSQVEAASDAPERPTGR
jgi:hypothetical protein